MTTPQPLFVRSRLPPESCGDWTLEHYEVRAPAEDLSDDRPPWARSAPGTYTRLRHGPTVFMTDGHDEWWSQREAIAEACRRGGDVLVTGLGLGVVVESMLQTPGSKVERITVLELAAEVIRLVAPHLEERHGERLEILHADAFDWQPPEGTRYSVVWHDIWANPYDAANLPQMDRLMARYEPFCDWQGVWARDAVVVEA